MGNRIVKHYRLTAFQDFLNDCALMDLECTACAFMRANNRTGDAFFKKRLDSVV